MNTTPYNIHKVTLLSFEPKITALQIKMLFKNDIEKQVIVDSAIKKRGAEWFQFKQGARSEIHLIKPFKLKYNKLLKKMDREQKKKNPLTFGIFENHVGIYVPNLTEIVNRIENHNKKIKQTIKQTKKNRLNKNKTVKRIQNNYKKLDTIQYVIFKREDGLIQLYVDLHGCIDYLEIDSFNYDHTKTLNKLKPIKFETKIIEEIQELENLRI
jgi:hypothetical protein